MRIDEIYCNSEIKVHVVRVRRRYVAFCFVFGK
jgi:hypothetical protein